MMEWREHHRAGSDRGTPNPRACDIAIVCPHMGDGGTQRVISLLAEGWRDRDRRVSVLTLFGDVDTVVLPESVDRIAVWPLRRGTGSFGPRSEEPGPRRRARFGRFEPLPTLRFYAALLRRVLALRRELHRLRPKAVLSFLPQANVMTLLATRGQKTRVLISERNDPIADELELAWRCLRRLLYRWADCVTANSLGAVEALRAYVPRDRLAYVPNPLRHPAPGSKPIREPVILTVGRFHSQKAHGVLLQAFARLPGHLDNWRLAILGRGPLGDELRAQANALGIGQRVDWAGYVEQTDPYYRRAAIFALPSRYEGMPNAMLEALSYGMPVIVSDASPGPLELIRDGENGIVVEAEDPARLAAQIERLAADPELRRRLGDSGRLAVRQFSLPAALDAWELVARL